MWYNVDFIKLARLLLPPMLRTKKLFALLCVLISPLLYVYSLFTDYRKRVTKRLNMSGQVLYLEKVLNDEFYLSKQEIYITGVKHPVLYLYKKGEQQSIAFLYKQEMEGNKVYVKEESEGNYSGDFIVYVPSFLNSDSYLNTIRTILNYYKPAGRSYKIEVYDYE